MNGSSSNGHGPLAYFDYAIHYGGSFTGTVMLASELQRFTDVSVIDVYGICEKYHEDLKRHGLPTHVLFEEWTGQTSIGGSSPISRLTRMTAAVPHVLATASRLRKALNEVKPRAVWVDSEKALFTLWLAAPPELAIAVYVRIETSGIQRGCELAWRRADAAMGVSTTCLTHLRAGGYAHDNLHVVYDGLDADAVVAGGAREPTGPLPGDADTFKMVLPATLEARKGHEYALRALAEFCASGKKAALWFCGDVKPGAAEAYAEDMHKLAADLSVQDHVHFLGWRDDIWPVMARSDAVLLPSLREGMPRVLLEGMALGKPVISTRVSGTPELVREGVDGLLVDPGDVGGLAEAFHVLSDASRRAEMGRAGALRVRERFSLQRQAHEFAAVLDEAAARRQA